MIINIQIQHPIAGSGAGDCQKLKSTSWDPNLETARTRGAAHEIKWKLKWDSKVKCRILGNKVGPHPRAARTGGGADEIKWKLKWVSEFEYRILGNKRGPQSGARPES